jgi:hypothetical protein
MKIGVMNLWSLTRISETTVRITCLRAVMRTEVAARTRLRSVFGRGPHPRLA